MWGRGVKLAAPLGHSINFGSESSGILQPSRADIHDALTWHGMREGSRDPITLVEQEAKFQSLGRMQQHNASKSWL